jgi:hypothetical protein
MPNTRFDFNRCGLKNQWERAHRVQLGNAHLPDHDPTEFGPAVFGMPNTQTSLYQVDPAIEAAHECAALAESPGRRRSKGPAALRGDHAENRSVRHAEHRTTGTGATRADPNSGGVFLSPRTQVRTVALSGLQTGAHTGSLVRHAEQVGRDAWMNWQQSGLQSLPHVERQEELVGVRRARRR